MNRIGAQLAVAIAVMGLVVGLTGQARASLLLGDSVHAVDYFPNTTSVHEDDGTLAVNPVAVFTSLNGVITSTVSDNQIQEVFHYGSQSFSVADFNGLVFTDVSRDPGITGVALVSSTLVGFDASRISFTSDSVSLNWQGLSFSDGNSIVVQLNSVSEVPEPSTFAGASLAIITGLASVWRRCKA